MLCLHQHQYAGAFPTAHPSPTLPRCHIVTRGLGGGMKIGEARTQITLQHTPWMPGTLKGENSTALGHPQHLMCRGEQYRTAKANCKPVCSYSLCPHLWFIWRARDLCSHSLWCWYLVPVSLPLFTAPSSVKLKVPVQFANSSPFCQLNCSPLARKRGS